MAKDSQQMKTLAELKRLENERDFFDGFERIEQKCRLKDQYPSANDLIGLDAYSTLLSSVYGKQEGPEKPVKGPNGELAGFTKSTKDKDDDNVTMIKQITDIVKKRKLEYSISIDGVGRNEFIKTRIQPKQEEDEEKSKDMIDKLADAIG